MSRLALLVGIDDYPGDPLYGCVNDARGMAHALQRHGDGSPNFQCRALLSDCGVITRPVLRRAVKELFEKEHAELALFYFAGHGARSEELGGYLVTQDHEQHDAGVSMADVITLANNSPARERIVILDCCHAGLVDELLATKTAVPLQRGVAVLAGCSAKEYAAEAGGQGLFTGLVRDALDGGAADVRGAVTIAGVFAYLNEVLTGWEQQPMLHANLAKLTPIRRARPAVSDEKLRRLTEWFTSADRELPLSPAYEPTAEPNDPELEHIFGVLQAFRAARLLEPVGSEHMYYAAVESRACRLTPLGQFYWRSVQAGKI